MRDMGSHPTTLCLRASLGRYKLNATISSIGGTYSLVVSTSIAGASRSSRAKFMTSAGVTVAKKCASACAPRTPA